VPWRFHDGVFGLDGVGPAGYVRARMGREAGSQDADGVTRVGGSDHIPDGIASGLPDVSLSHATTVAQALVCYLQQVGS